MCHLYPYKNVKFYGNFFYINVCGFIGRGKFLYETRVLDSSYLQYKVQLLTSDSTEITAGGIKVKSLVLHEIVGWSQNYIRGRYAPSLPPSGKIL